MESRYTDRKPRGRGGQSVVDAVRDEVIGREVALKELHPGTPPDGVQRFLREARITGQLEHQAIVPVHDLVQPPAGQPYYTMKLVVGESLAERLKACRTLADRLGLLDAFEKVCEAVAFAHSKRIIHRDIKPENVMISAFGQTYLVDWGLARSLDQSEEPVAPGTATLEAGSDRLTSVGSILGTPSYMSPEQARGDLERVDFRSDVWGLGATLYEMVSDRAPFQGDSAIEVVFKHLEEVPLEPVPADVPRPLASIVRKALQRDPDRRYQTADALLADLRAWRRGDPVGSHTYTLWEKVRLARNQKRLAATLLFTACATVVVAVSLASLVFNQNARVLQMRDLQQRMAETEVAGRHLDEERIAAREAMQNLFFSMANQLKDLPGSGRAQETLLQAGRDYYLKQQAQLDDQDNVALAAVLDRMAMLAYDLGRVGEARETLARAQRLLDDLPADQIAAVRRNRAVLFQHLGGMAEDAGDPEAAQASLSQALTLTEAMLADRPHDAMLRRDQAADLLGLGTASTAAGRLDEADAQFKSAVDILAALASDAAGRRDLSEGCVNLGDLVAARGQRPAPWYQRAAQALQGEEAVPEALGGRIDLLLRQGHYDAAWRLMSPLLDRDPDNWSRAAAGAETALAAGHPAEAVRAAHRVLQSKCPSWDTRFFTAVHLMVSNWLLRRPTEARAAGQRALRELEAVHCGSSWSLYAVRHAVRDPRLKALYDGLEKARLLGARAPQAMKAVVERFLNAVPSGRAASPGWMRVSPTTPESPVQAACSERIS